ncbi:hypothetical protein H4582DRAFT_1934823 [Lactarius indigo]|nr:hypothetical protein H4582DRAFT_1934823 [Lactarius indigo]
MWHLLELRNKEDINSHGDLSYCIWPHFNGPARHAQPMRRALFYIDSNPTSPCRCSSLKTSPGLQKKPTQSPKNSACERRLGPWGVSVRATHTRPSMTSPSLTMLKGIPSKLWILPPKRRHSTQAPEPRRSSFLTGSWETMWDCDAEGSYLATGVQCEELDREVTTPICDASWNTDEETTPLFSSNFPRQPDHRELWDEGRLT